MHSASPPFDSAIADFDKAIRLTSDYAEAYGGRGWAYFNRGNRAVSAAGFANGEFARGDDGAYSLGVHRITRWLVLAAALLTPSVATPALADNWADCVQQADSDLGARACNKIIISGKESGENLSYAYNNRGIANNGKGSFDSAIADFDKAIRLTSDYAEAYGGRGWAYFNRGNRAVSAAGFANGDWDRAIADFDKAIQLKPDYAEGYGRRGWTYFNSADRVRAIADYDRAIQLKWHYGQAYYWRGIAYDSNGGYAQALLDYRAAVRLTAASASDPWRPQALLRIAEMELAAATSQKPAVETPVVAEGAILHSLTIPEGVTSEQVISCMTADSVPEGEDIPGLNRVEEEKCRASAAALAGEAPAPPPEGSILPETYAFSRGDTRANVLNRMLRERDRILTEVWNRRAPDLPLSSINELVVLASVVEKETGLADERSRVAAVFINRLRLNMRLQSDPTVAYGMFGGKGKPADYTLSKADLETASPYNTYVNEGLPPGPIANPGRASLEAVANPSRTRDLFFVADGSGGHAFAETYEDHLRNVARWRHLNANAVQTAGTNFPPSPAADSTKAPGSNAHVVQKAILYEEPLESAASSVTAMNAAVTWRFVENGPTGPEVEASLTVPEREMKIRFALHKNIDQTLPASHLIEVVVDIPEDFPGKAIRTVPRIVMKPTEEARGQALVGMPAKVTDGFFWIALSADGQDVVSNLGLLRERNWIDLPFVYETGQRAILTFEKGTPGERSFEQAVAAWGSESGTSSVAAGPANGLQPSRRADDWADCVQQADPALGVRACTSIVNSGKESGENLAYAYNGRGNAYSGKGDYDLAIADFDKAIQLKPDLAKAYYGRGMAYEAKYPGRTISGGFDSSLVDLTKVTEISPDFGPAYLAIAKIYYRIGQTSLALSYFEKAASLTPAGDPLNAQALARIAEIEKKLPAVAPKPKVEMGASSPTTSEDWADCAQQADLDGSIRVCTEIIISGTESGENLAGAYGNRGNAHGLKGDHDLAIADNDKAIQIKPDFAYAYNGRGNTYHRQGAYDRAIVDFDKAIQLKPDYADAYNGRGGAYTGKGDYDREGLLIAYAARDGQLALDGKGSNSPFAQALMRYLAEPGLEIGLVFRKVRDAVWKATEGKQEPFTYGALPAEELYFLPK